MTDELCSMCCLIQTLYPEGRADTESAALIVRAHFRQAHGTEMRPMEVLTQ